MAQAKQKDYWSNEPEPKPATLAPQGPYAPRDVPSKGKLKEPRPEVPQPAPRPDYLMQAMDYGRGSYNVRAPTIRATNREVGDNELSSSRLDNILGADSPLMQRAAAQGREMANARGLMNSSIAAGNAMGAMIDRASPLAMQEAGTYSQAASENMQATNAAAMQNAINQLNAGIASTGYNAQRDSQIRGALFDTANREDTQQWQSGENVAQRGWQTGEREAGQEWQSGENQQMRDWESSENVAQRGWQTGEREASQEWSAGEAQLAREFTATQSQLDRDQQFLLTQLGFDHAELMQLNDQDFRSAEAALDRDLQRAGMMQQDRHMILQMIQQDRNNYAQFASNAAFAIFNNPEMTASQQNQALAALSAIWENMGAGGELPDMPDIFKGTAFEGIWGRQPKSGEKRGG